MSTEYRNPLHPESLTPNELVPRRRIVSFNTHNGVQGKYIVTDFPEEGPYGQQIKLRMLDTDEERVYFLGDMGVAPYRDGRWNEQNFVVDINNIGNLPPTRPHP